MEHNQTHIKVFLILISLFGLFTCTTCSTQWYHEEKYPSPGDWLNHGGNIYNRRYAEGETKISPSTAPKLRLKWEFYAGDDVSATPAIYKGIVYFPSWNGYLYAVKASDGSLVWKKNLQKLTGLKSTLPTILNITSAALLSRC
ncbi:unnamed protein product [Fraxinus pennsylvanica]|uniref:Uncharacterized protein n=1 Tax=Fraxinus pennsylvanica TaxID=56036 RepID=A0AAD1YKL5_9LAMI|nr:unnamed protein product [Fraxinus pennsylvanica]